MIKKILHDVSYVKNNHDIFSYQFHIILNLLSLAKKVKDGQTRKYSDKILKKSNFLVVT